MSVNINLSLTFSLLIAALSLMGNQSMANQTAKHNLSLSPLKECPNKPNCINSEYPDKTNHYLPAINFPDTKKEQLMAQAKTIILNMGGTIIKEENHYLAATFTSSLFKFVDDFELRQDNTTHKLHIRSASRTGYSDFGVNKRRVQKFSEQFNRILENKSAQNSINTTLEKK